MHMCIHMILLCVYVCVMLIFLSSILCIVHVIRMLHPMRLRSCCVCGIYYGFIPCYIIIIIIIILLCYVMFFTITIFEH